MSLVTTFFSYVDQAGRA